MPDEDKNFGGSLVLDFRKRPLHMQAKNYCSVCQNFHSMINTRKDTQLYNYYISYFSKKNQYPHSHFLDLVVKLRQPYSTLRKIMLGKLILKYSQGHILYIHLSLLMMTSTLLILAVCPYELSQK